MPLDTEPNQEFLKFISIQGSENKFTNLEKILNLEEKYPGMFMKVMVNFDHAKSYRKSLNEKGMPIKVPLEDGLKKFYENKAKRFAGWAMQNKKW